MNPQDIGQAALNGQNTQPEVKNPLSVMQPGEQVICEIKRHPIGMLGIYIGAGFLLIVLAIIVFVVAPGVLTSVEKGKVMAIGGLLLLLASFICLGFVFISNKVYWGNSWVLTSDSVTQISQRSLFDRQSSQLSLGNLEDVTAGQDGILAHMFNYGVLRVETAGERSKFMFPFCPNPNYYAQQILNAREQFEQHRRSSGQQGQYQPQGSYSPDNGVNINT